MDYQKIINLYYPAETELRRILLTHSQDVTSRALSIAANHSELHLDIPFIREAAMLHDLGIFLTDAPSIQCFGKQPYICHGILGAQLLRELGYERHARVCERHTGAGITRQAIQSQQLPLPLQDFLPETMEEQLICYSDKFYSKSHLERVRNVEQAAKSLEKFGTDSVQRFMHWVQMFE